MKKYFVVLFVLVFVATVGLIGCEKKAEAPKPAEQPAVTPPPPPTVTPAPAPKPAAPAPAPAPVKPAKPAKK